MPVEDNTDPPEGSEEGTEPRTDTPGEGSCWPFKGDAGWGRWLQDWWWRQFWEAGILRGVVSPGLISWSLFVLYLPMAVIHLPSILDQDSPPSPDDITKEKRTPAPEPKSSYEASEPPAKRSKR